MFDKVAAAFSIVALGAAGYAVFQTGKMASTVNTAAISAGASQSTTISDEVIEQYLRDNPEVVIASLEKYQIEQRAAQQQQQAQEDIALVSTNKEEIFEDGYSFVAGNPDGDITVVEFSDYNCGYCKRAHTAVAEFIEADGNVRLVVKEYPILGPGSTIAGRAALASAMQEESKKYAPFNDALMKHRGSHTEETVMKIAAEVGLDVEQLLVDMQSPDIDKKIKRTFELADKLSINGTPAFIIGNQVVRGFVPASELQRLAEAARSS